MAKLIVIFFACFISCLKEPNNCEMYYERKEAVEPLSISLIYGYTLNTFVEQGRNSEYVFTGDSLVHYWMFLKKNDPGGYNWMTEFEITNIVNTAIAGNTSCDLMARKSKHVDSFKPKYIFTDGGGNDFKYGVNNNVIMDNLFEYLSMVRNANPNARIVYGAIPPTKIPYANANKGQINSYVRDVVIQSIGNACFIELQDFLSEDGNDGSPIKSSFSLDGTHFQPHVYVEYKKRVDIAFNTDATMNQPAWLSCYF